MKAFEYTSRCTFGFALLAILAACSAETSDDDDIDVDAVTGLNANAKKPKPDAGTNSGIDAGTESGTDAGTDGGTDAGTDGGVGNIPPPNVDACLLPGTTIATFTPYGTIDGTDEGATRAMPLPFAFTYFGTTYSEYWLTSNGELGFGNAPGGAAFGRVSCPLPDAQISKPMVFAYTTDLMAGTACVATTGTAPNRQLVITWKDKTLYELDGTGNGSSNVAFGVTLGEGTNAIDIAIHRVDIYSPFFPPEDIVNGSWAVVGLQSGPAAVSFSCHAPNAPPGSTFHYAP